MSENPRPKQEPVSVDGAVYALVVGEWTRVGFSGRAKDPDAKPFSLPDGQVSVDGALIAVADGAWKHKDAGAPERNADPVRSR